MATIPASSFVDLLYSLLLWAAFDTDKWHYSLQKLTLYADNLAYYIQGQFCMATQRLRGAGKIFWSTNNGNVSHLSCFYFWLFFIYFLCSFCKALCMNLHVNGPSHKTHKELAQNCKSWLSNASKHLNRFGGKCLPNNIQIRLSVMGVGGWVLCSSHLSD